jgi:hypothetical protein
MECRDSGNRCEDLSRARDVGYLREGYETFGYVLLIEF